MAQTSKTHKVWGLKKSSRRHVATLALSALGDFRLLFEYYDRDFELETKRLLCNII